MAQRRNRRCNCLPKKDFVEGQALVAVNYGSMDNHFRIDGKEYKPPLGIAHFLEHKLFESKDKNVFELFSQRGAMVNAYTNFTNTAYYFTSVDNFMDNYKALLEFTGEPYFTDENVEKEKGIISQEIKMYQDYPFWRVYFNLLEAMYQEHGIKHNIAGSVKSIQEITKEMLYDCYEAFYRPDNMVICSAAHICGDSYEELFKIAEELVKSKKKAHVEKLTPMEGPRVNNRLVEEKMQVSRPMFNIGFKDTDFSTIREETAKRIAASKMLLDYIAGDSSPFYESMYERGLLDSSFGMEYLSGEGFGAAIFSGYSDKPYEVLSHLLTEIEALKHKGFDRERFNDIKNKHIGLFIRQFDSINSITAGQVDMVAKGIDLFQLVEAYSQVDQSDLMKILTGFGEDNHALSQVMPK